MSEAASPRARIAGRGRPLEDPACAGCPQLLLLRALRRVGLEVEGGLGCEPPRPGGALPARTARVAGVADAREAAGSGARLAIVADRGGPARARAALAALPGAEPLSLAASAAEVEERVRRAAEAEEPALLVAIAPCVHGAPRAPALAVDPARCNRCGACLALGCVALHDPGGEAAAIDPARCTGCGLCAPLCRSGAIAAR